jgi:CubicO group peptidase (beta-lactamase class C family)
MYHNYKPSWENSPLVNISLIISGDNNKEIMQILSKRKYVGYWIVIFPFICLFGMTCYASSAYWPTEGWRTATPEEQGMHSNILADMLEEIQIKSYSIDSITIIRNGFMVADAYFYPFSKGQKHIIHSCTKSIMSALIGIAIDKGYIKNVDQTIVDFFSDRKISNLNKHKKSITLENLLTMASGLECRDSWRYGYVGLGEMMNSDDWAQYVLDLPTAEPPGERFEYCNGVSYLLSVIIQKTTNMRTLEFAKKNLFGPLGITDVRWQTSPQGIDIGWGRMWLKPHDMAKIGWLYLNKGRWADKQIVPAMWVKESTRAHIDATDAHYGYQWWVDSNGYYAAVGAKGQGIFVLPDKNIVTVFTGDLPDKAAYPDRPAYIIKNLLKSYIIPAAVSTKPLPFNPKESARFADLQASISEAPAKGFIWTSEKEGVAKDGVFKRTASPRFKFEYPLGSRKAAIEDPSQVMRMKTPEDVFFSASVMHIPADMKLDDIDPKFYARNLPNVQIISNKKITLKCGTNAYRTDMKWLWKNSIPISSVFVSAFKDGKLIFIAVHSREYKSEIDSIIESLEFE